MKSKSINKNRSAHLCSENLCLKDNNFFTKWISSFYNKLKCTFILFAILLWLGQGIIINAQPLTQTIIGQVIDKQSEQTLPGAVVTIPGTAPLIVTSTDTHGNFKLSNIPIGRVTVQVTYVGYETVTLGNIYLNSGKEMVLHIEMEEKVQTMEEVTITADSSKEKPINNMALLSARSFTVEETEKYAGSRGDVSRMASNFAGVSFSNDSRNDIIIRGNSPSGLLWRLEDVDVPNPNHFAENGTTGGPVSMLNNNDLRNSDFITGAFPAEYGNALSGVFDLKMRNGNNEKHEFLGQVGFNGFELGAEGPINRAHGSSYLVNYRYSTLEVLNQLGVNYGTAGVPQYQDLNLKIVFPVSKGIISIFGLAGKSQISMLASELSDNDFYLGNDENLYNGSKMATSGISYTRFLTDKTYAKIILSGFYQWGGTNIDTLSINKAPTRYYSEGIGESRISITVLTGTKFNSRLSTKSGITVDQMGYNLSASLYNETSKNLSAILNGNKNVTDGVHLIRTFYELSYKLTDKITLNPGLNLMFFELNRQLALEPRAGISWKYANNRTLTLGYGLDSKTQTLATYYLGTYVGPDNQYVETNRKLGFTESNQFVLGHEWNIRRDIHLKTEIYYQYLFDVPVESKPSFYSVLNDGAYWGVQTNDSLVNKGTGRNYGLELTFEKFFSRGYYFLVTSSLFDSKYKGSNGIERNTAFDGNYVINTLIGKEIPVGNRATLNIDYKMAFAGGKRYTPIDTVHSNTVNTVYLNNESYRKQFSPYFKADIKIGFKLNGRKISQEWQAYVENFTNHQNVLEQTFSYTAPGKISTTYQLGFFPMFLYRINF
jgi:hypothetical protein